MFTLFTLLYMFWVDRLMLCNYITPDDESIDSKHVEKCKECKHLGTLIKIVVHIEGQKVNRIWSLLSFMINVVQTVMLPW
jgi:hypothetical protein